MPRLNSAIASGVMWLRVARAIGVRFVLMLIHWHREA
jgi:hypothetical protein